MDKVSILGVKIDNLSKKEILEKIEYILTQPKFHQIATINPEFILEAQKNIVFKNILNSCNLNVADGFGIKLAFWRYGEKLKARLAGADLLLEILRLADEKKLSVFLACREDGISSFEETRNAILKIYPNLKIAGKDISYNCHSEQSEESRNFSEKTIIARSFANAQDDKIILLCSFGAPHQELFINSLKCDTIRLAMGVGGSFDFLTRKVKRAPKFLRQIGLEWFWRLAMQPKRWLRIFRATIIFPLKIILWKEK